MNEKVIPKIFEGRVTFVMQFALCTLKVCSFVGIPRVTIWTGIPSELLQNTSPTICECVGELWISECCMSVVRPKSMESSLFNTNVRPRILCCPSSSQILWDFSKIYSLKEIYYSLGDSSTSIFEKNLTCYILTTYRPCVIALPQDAIFQKSWIEVVLFRCI